MWTAEVISVYQSLENIAAGGWSPTLVESNGFSCDWRIDGMLHLDLLGRLAFYMTNPKVLM